MMYFLDAWVRYVLAAAVVGVTVWLPIVMAGEPSVHYISHPVRRDYLMAKDTGLYPYKKNTMDIITRNVCKLDLPRKLILSVGESSISEFESMPTKCRAWELLSKRIVHLFNTYVS